MGLFSWFKKKTHTTPIPVVENALFFYEDDFCQVELVPRQNLPFLTNEIQIVNQFAAEHSSEHGYTSTYLRNDPPVELETKQIHAALFEETVKISGLERAVAVVTGYGSNYREECKDTVGYSKGYAAIYYSHNNGMVKNVWITNYFIINKDRFTEFLLQCGLKWDLLLVDWNTSVVIDICNREEIEKYLNG